MFGMGVGEILLIVLLLLLLFGAKRIPEIAKGLGSGIRTFKTELKNPEPEEKPRELSRPEGGEPRPAAEDPRPVTEDPRPVTEDPRPVTEDPRRE